MGWATKTIFEEYEERSCVMCKNIFTLIFLFFSCLISTSQENIRISDVDGNIYDVVNIGEQWWIAENLKTTKFNDGSNILSITDSIQWVNNTSPAYAWYKNNVNTYKNYGALYNWYAASSNKLCPIGWRVPSDQDFRKMVKYLDPNASDMVVLSEIAGEKLKDTNWPSYENVTASNSTGFSAIAAGCRGWSGWYNSDKYFGYFWCSNNWSIALRWATNRVFIGDNVSKHIGISIRCVRDTQPENMIEMKYPVII